ncbi:site-specific integrase [Xinfangfangia sp. D13-10-4-6]|uniref:tyrosine-type recombinase/integrase n=1 Tax=Pseudogemmobacter hezensis TaxID=2737662 RepID=UPI001557E797|nr:tyrosine-type recombinase/integrase [Pseudogemmobacter hezensis]NPD16259.1 site-specific integrase [Pseudogemmobacter hezensis]
MAFSEGSPEYLAALSAARPVAEKAKGLFREVLLDFLASQDFLRLSKRTQSDMRGSIFHPKSGIDQKFGSAPRTIFDDSRIRGAVLRWRDEIGGKVGDDRMRHLQRIVGWAHDRTALRQNHLTKLKGMYRSNRSEILWTEAEIEAFLLGAPPHIARILIAATETGLRPGDLAQLGPAHIHPTSGGKRIVIWTTKRKRLASIPVTPRMDALIEDTPDGQAHFIVNKGGQPYQHENYLGDAISQWRDRLGIRAELRLYDARGTAATRLLWADASLKEIATCMGWSIKHAAEVIGRYAALSPEMSDGIAKKLEAARKGS